MIKANVLQWLAISGSLPVLGAIAYAYKRDRRVAKQRRLKRRICAALKKHLGQDFSEDIIGFGNTGCVFACKPNAPMLDGLGIRLPADRELPARVAVKFAHFEEPRLQAELLREISSAIDEAQQHCGGQRLCPNLSISLFPHDAPADGQFVVEVMPLIEGQSLRSAVKSELAIPGAVLELSEIIRTVDFLEQRCYYSASVDVDNVIVTPDGRWIRIDFDRVAKVAKFPLARMKRISIVVLKVLKSNPRLEAAANSTGLIDRLRATRMKKRRSSQMITSPGELLTELEVLLKQFPA